MTGSIKRGRLWAVVIGIGLALSPIHNLWLTNLVTNNGVVGLFLPAFGSAIWIIATLYFLFVADNWQDVNDKGKLVFSWRRIDWGDRRVVIPLIVIVVAMGLSGITSDTLGKKVAPFLMGLSLLSLYLVARKLGKDMFLPLAIGAGLASLGIISYALWHPGVMTGGFVFEKNYDIATGFILLGTALFIHKWQWLLASLALVAMFLSGSPEAVFVLGVMSLVVLWRRDWNNQLIIALIPIVVIMSIWFSVGTGQKLYQLTGYILRSDLIKQGKQPPLDGTEERRALSGRIEIAKDAMVNLKPLGEGYGLTKVGKVLMVHNVPLVIVQQLGWVGILAGLAWVWVSTYSLIKSKWKYVWVLILALSVFDYYMWLQLAPFWWVAIGVSLSSHIQSDLVFRKAKIEGK